MTKGCLLIFGLAALLIPTQATYAGPYSDELSKCFIESTTVSDRATFVKWMFSAASSHPAVKSIAEVSQEQLDSANKQVAEIIMKILTDSCSQKAEKAIRYEGSSALETSFGVLGEVAGQELFSSPDVAASMANVANYLDEEKLNSALTMK